MAISGKAVLGLSVAGAAIGLIFLLRKKKPPEGARPAPADGRGDVNMDGWVSSADIALMKQIILKLYTPTAEEFRRADVNCDGVVSILDQIEIQRYLVTGEMAPCS